MVICVAVDCKSDSRQGKAKVLWISQERKSETVMAHKVKTEISSRYNMSESIMLIASAKIPAEQRCDFSWP